MPTFPPTNCPRCANPKPTQARECWQCEEDDIRKVIGALKNLAEAAEPINLLIAEDKTRYAAWVQEADALYDATEAAIATLAETEPWDAVRAAIERITP